MGRWFIWGGAFIALFLIMMANLHTASSKESDSYAKEWGLILPSGRTAELVVLGAMPNPDDNRAKFNILIYKDLDEFSSIRGLKKISEENLEDIQGEILAFQTRAIQHINYLDDVELTKAFEEFSPDPQVGDSYYYKKDKKGNFFFAIVKVDESKVYTFEWSEELR